MEEDMEARVLDLAIRTRHEHKIQVRSLLIVKFDVLSLLEELLVLRLGRSRLHPKHLGNTLFGDEAESMNSNLHEMVLGLIELASNMLRSYTLPVRQSHYDQVAVSTTRVGYVL